MNKIKDDYCMRHGNQKYFPWMQFDEEEPNSARPWQEGLLCSECFPNEFKEFLQSEKEALHQELILRLHKKAEEKNLTLNICPENGKVRLEIYHRVCLTIGIPIYIIPKYSAWELLETITGDSLGDCCQHITCVSI